MPESEPMDVGTTTPDNTDMTSSVPHYGPQPIQVVFSFDTTGSMSMYLDEVRNKLKDTIQRLFMDIPCLQIAVFAHGDYCDAKWSYVTKFVDFTNDVGALCTFVNDVSGTGGGDSEECYELVLREVREKLSWKPGTQRSLVMIGDDLPHNSDYTMNEDNIDWEEEVQKLRDQMGVKIYSVQAGSHPTAKHQFWGPLAQRTGGRYLTLTELQTVIDMMMAICYREHGVEYFQAYEKEVRAREGPGMRNELDTMFHALRGETSESTSDPALIRKVSTTKRETKPRRTTGAAKKSTIDKKTTGATCLKSKTKPTALAPAERKAIKMVGKKATVTKIQTKAGRKHREKEFETRFALRDLKWTPWQLAFAQSDTVNNSALWGAARDGFSGSRRLALFRGAYGVPAVYEFAVQPRVSCRKYVMGCRCTNGFNGMRWDTYLCKGAFKKNIENAIENGCKVFVRRAVITKRTKCGDQVFLTARDVTSFLRRQYDYAWNMYRRGCTRTVQWRNIDISV